MRISDWSSDVCSSDLRMPGMSGVELCRRLKERVPAHVKIIALTAQALPDEQEEVLKQGFDGVLMKPFRETELLKLLEETARSAPSRNLTNDGSGISPEPATTDNAFTSQNNVDAPLMDLRSEEHTSELQSLMRNS